MKIVSGFVREQQRYTKKQLHDIFFANELGIEKFIKDLKSYGILKTVANNKEQKNLTDLIDEDVQVVDDEYGVDDCLYVFDYVGVVTIGNRVIKIYPKYILSEDNLVVKVKQVIKVLERYSHSEEQIINLFSGYGDNKNFNILAIILYLLNDYFEYGVYNNTQNVREINGEGEILWNRTIDDGFAFIQENRPYYTELITRRNINDDTDYFRLLHECILTECSKQLNNAELEDLFGIEQVALSDASIDDFGEKDYILNRIEKELNVQFNTHKQITLKTLYTYIAQDRKMFKENQGISMFGTTAFHAVWEKACADVFGNRLNTPVGQLEMKIPLKDRYDKKTKLIDLIKKPEWRDTQTEHKPKEAEKTLKPDLISINNFNGKYYFIIFDAKYYVLQLEEGRKLSGNPGVEDVAKQYLYQLAYKEFIEAHEFAAVKNCFLLPTDGDSIVIKGTARMNMLSNLGLEDIQIRLIPATNLFEHYLSRKQMPIWLLKL